ncbi:MAG: hypothetical protein ACPGNT_11065 [Rhodospirillales bacterium]
MIEKPTVSKKGLILASVALMLAGVVTFPLFALNIMAFAAPGSDENPGTYVWVLGLIAVPILAVIGGLLTLIVKKPIFLLMPALGLPAWVIGKMIESAVK